MGLLGSKPYLHCPKHKSCLCMITEIQAPQITRSAPIPPSKATTERFPTFTATVFKSLFVFGTWGFLFCFLLMNFAMCVFNLSPFFIFRHYTQCAVELYLVGTDDFPESLVK